LGDEGITLILTSINVDSPIKVLNLSNYYIINYEGNTQMTNKNLTILLQAIRNMKNIEEICLEGNDITDHDWHIIFESTMNCPMIKKGSPGI
jgi:hypothetical protein